MYDTKDTYQNKIEKGRRKKKQRKQNEEKYMYDQTVVVDQG